MGVGEGGATKQQLKEEGRNERKLIQREREGVREAGKKEKDGRQKNEEIKRTRQRRLE